MGVPARLPPFLTQIDGEIRAAGTRVSLVDIVAHYKQGFSPEMLGGRFPSVELAAIRYVIGFYMENRPAVDVLIEEALSDAEKARSLHVPDQKMLQLRQRVHALHAARMKDAHVT